MAKHTEGEKYLHPRQYYIDLYDLFTINRCLDDIKMYQEVYKKSKKTKELKHVPEEEAFRTVNWMLDKQLMVTMTNEYKGKQDTIDKWISRDRKKQEVYDTAVAPKHKCANCSVLMKSIFKTLDYADDDNPRVLFMLDCPKCNKREAIYDDGEVWESKPFLCPECNKEAKYDHKIEGDISTWTTTCKHCGYKDKKVEDSAKWRKEQKAKEKKDKELLEKYRDKFCLSDAKGIENIELFESLNVANYIYEEEIAKYDSKEYEDTLKIKMVSIPELEKMLNELVSKAGYIKLTFEKPEILQHITIPISVQDDRTERLSRESSTELEGLLKKALAGTNWKLLDTVSYRLGYLQTRLRGYESEEDLRKLTTKKQSTKQKSKTELDPELISKHATSNAVQLAKLTGKWEGKNRARKRRLKTEPDGFFLNDTDGYLTCSICRRSTHSSKIWWNEYGQRCTDCWNNIKAGVIPKDLKSDCESEGQWISEDNIRDRHGVHPATRAKYVREGFLVPTKLQDSAGMIYMTLFMEDQNKKFLKKHPKIEKKKPKITIKSTNKSGKQ